MQRRNLPVAGVGLLGILFGHSLTYLMAAPAAGQRTVLLQATGHSYWEYATLLVLLISAVGAAAVAASHFRAAMRGEHAQRLDYRDLAFRLAAIEVVGFSALEIVERVGAGGSFVEAISASTFRYGLLVQIVVALGLALLIKLLAGAAAVLGRLLYRGPVSRARAVRATAPATFARTRFCEATRQRGPPLVIAQALTT